MTGELRLVKLSPDDVVAFNKIREVMPDVAVMIDAGVFDFRSGSMVIHRDLSGKLQKIEVGNMVKWLAPRKPQP